MAARENHSLNNKPLRIENRTQKTMLTAKYPIIDSTDFVEITIETPTADLESNNADFRCVWHIKAPNYEKKNTIYGIDEIQCVWLVLRHLRTEILLFEKHSNSTCAYRFFQDFEI